MQLCSPTAFTSIPSSNCDGISSASIWQKVTNYLRVYSESRVWGQASIALHEPQLDPLQNGYHMVSDGQLIPAVVVKQTVLLSGVLAEPTTYPALIFASEAVSVRMMRTQNKHDTDDDGDFDDL